MSSFNARIFDELEPCYPDTPVENGYTHYSVAGANGTYVGASILLGGLTPGIPVTVEVKGEHGAYKLFRMIPVPVEVNTGAKLRTENLKNDKNENVIRRAPFMVYEALEPIYNIVMPELTTMGLSFKTAIEYCRENKLCTFAISISHGGEEIMLTLDVEQYAVTVPRAGRETHKYVNWFSLDAIAKHHHVEYKSEHFYSLLSKYLRAAVFSRQNMLAVPIGACFSEGKLDEAFLARYIDIAKKAGIVYFQGGAVATRALSLADNDDFYNSLEHNKIKSPDEIAEAFKEKAFDYFDNGEGAVDAFCGKPIPGEGLAVIESYTKQLYDFIERNGLADSWIQCALDEPNDALCEVYGEITGVIRRTMPNIPILEPVLPTEKVAGALDIWCPSLDIYEQNRSFFDDRVNKGDRLFVYSCLTPGGNYCNRMLDFERLRMVWLGWAPAKYANIEGFLHWGANQWSNLNPYRRQAAMFSEQPLEFHPKRAMFLPAGDNGIFYPGFDEALISVRSEAHRIGYEDLCLLTQLKEKDEAAATSIIDSVFRGYGDYEKAVPKYRQARLALLKALTR